LIGCVDEPREVETAETETYLCSTSSCDGPVLPRCSSTCSASADCDTPCRLPDGSSTSCGDQGSCRSCGSTCSASADCYESCKGTNGAITSCGALNTCQKYDVYCAYPTITSAAVSSTHESSSVEAYMYYASASNPKSGQVPVKIGGEWTDTNDAWAANFRGPIRVTGATAKTQWEWDNDDYYGMATSFRFVGAPYTYGRECIGVPRGKSTVPTIPRLTTKAETVYEDDECLDEFSGVPGTGAICNPDDLVGHFWIDRSACTTQVFNAGQAQGWTTQTTAISDGSVAKVKYKMYCYSCKGSWSADCSTGYQY